ncbi:ATP-dependent RNA helicase RhlB [Fulvimarina sp. 2208YS6-2-32]|uniref:ATP-dependent RNA helicase RhlB n=1 Tax=Fulvimarina uroteuthidis TaxID=3098149 RepID=UPI003A0FBF88
MFWVSTTGTPCAAVGETDAIGKTSTAPANAAAVNIECAEDDRRSPRKRRTERSPRAVDASVPFLAKTCIN